MKKLLFSIPVLFLWILSLSSGSVYVKGTDTLKDTILDQTTGLRWLRCPLKADGSVDTSSTCTDAAGAFTWEEAKTACTDLGTASFAGISTWRLPEIRELQSIALLYFNAVPRINSKYFPNTGNNFYWSNTTYIGRSMSVADNDTYAWCIDFTFGNPNPYDKSLSSQLDIDFRIRCVMTP